MIKKQKTRYSNYFIEILLNAILQTEFLNQIYILNFSRILNTFCFLNLLFMNAMTSK